MEAAAIIALVDGFIMLAQKLAPVIQQAVHNGDITPAQQKELEAKIESIRDGSAFQGPEWQISK